MQLVQERDGGANRPLADVFEPDEQDALEAASEDLEGKTEKQKNPHPRGRCRNGARRSPATFRL